MSSRSAYKVWPGRSFPLGATWDGNGVNFALFSAHAERVELCLFDDQGKREIARIPLCEYTDEVWHGYLPDVRPGAIYGYRVYGAWDPQKGHRFNGHKLLLDPYAKAVVGRFQWKDQNFAFRADSPKGDLSFDRRNNARFVPKGVVLDVTHPWTGASTLDIPWQETVIYEAHVRGMTIRHPEVQNGERGTFAGLAAPEVLRYLRDLGINTLELLPINPVLTEQHLHKAGLTNYWGYNPYNYFAVDPRLLSSGRIAEMRTAVSRLHDAGIQVILDVVYNHTGEGSHIGPTVNFRGIDNKSYYKLDPDNPRYYLNHSGCGNTLNLSHPRVLQMVMDSLRYWVEVMHVDGFRFDLATSMTRIDGSVRTNSPFMAAVRQDPVLSRVKMIAEPWDLGPDGYQVGRFPPGWSEWNDKYRDTVRSFWKGTGGLIGEVANCLTGSSDRFDHNGRRPRSSINFVTAHDGFTLEDLVSFDRKHNEANLENNQDGTNNNISWNCGVEGPTDDPEVIAARFQQKRNLMATLLLSQGVPMVVMGDEQGRSQKGNNNAYCQDNEISWLNWSMHRPEDRKFYRFVRKLIRLRKNHPVFCRPRFFHGEYIEDSPVKDITWLAPEGRELSDREWRLDYARCFGFHLGGDTGDYYSRSGIPLVDQRFIVLVNAHYDSIPFILPGRSLGEAWEVEFDTARPDRDSKKPIFRPAGIYRLRGRSLVLLRQHKPGNKRRNGGPVRAMASRRRF